MKRIILAAIAGSAVAVLLMMRKSKKNIPASVEPLTRRMRNEDKHLTTVFSKAKNHGMENVKVGIE